MPRETRNGPGNGTKVAKVSPVSCLCCRREALLFYHPSMSPPRGDWGGALTVATHGFLLPRVPFLRIFSQGDIGLRSKLSSIEAKIQSFIPGKLIVVSSISCAWELLFIAN